MDEQQATTEREQWERWMAEAKRRAMMGPRATHRMIDKQPIFLYYSSVFEDFYLMNVNREELVHLGKTVDDILEKIGSQSLNLAAFLDILPSKVDDR